MEYRLDLMAGLNFIANQLDHGSNRLNEVMPDVPDGCAFYKYNNGPGTWTVSIYSAGARRWLNGDSLTLSPGEGAFLDSPRPFTLTFTGTPHVPVLPVSISSGHTYLLSRQTNDVGRYEDIVGAAPPPGTALYQWNRATARYDLYVFDEFDLLWTPSIPMADVGEPVWIAAPGGGAPHPAPTAGGLTVLSPTNGSYCAGSSQTITWTGGNPSWNVLISLVDVPSWTVYSTITASTPNTGSFPWIIPPTLPPSTYLIYIQEVTLTTWTYGGSFTVVTCPTNPCVSAPGGLALWLPLDETTGPVSANLAPGGNNGTQLNGPLVLGGYVSNSLSFNGVNQAVTVPDYAAINPGAGQDFSVDAWVKRALTSPNSPPSVIVDKRDANTGVGYSLALSFGNLVFQMNDGSGFTNFRDTGTVPPDNRWHLVAVTVIRNQTNGGRFYIDGSATATFDPTAYPGSLASTASFRVAASPVGGNAPWLGAIDEVEFFRRALSPGEIYSVFLAGPAGKCKQGCGTPLAVKCPTDKTVECGATWTFDPPVVSDPTCTSAAIRLVSSNSVPLVPCGAMWTAVWEVTGCCGDLVTCSQTVTMVDTTPPTINCGQDEVLSCGLSWDFTVPIVTDNCGPAAPKLEILSTATNSGCPFRATRIWLATDACGNSTTCTQNVTVIDQQPPLLTCASDKTVECGSAWRFDPPVVSDACCGTNVSVSVSSTVTNADPANPCARQMTRTWVAVDCCQNARECSQTVTVINTQPPVLSCAGDRTVECGSAWDLTPPVASDPCCGTNVSIILVGTVTNGTGCAQVLQRTWLARGCCGLTSTCQQTITVVDTTPPVFTAACVTNRLSLGGNDFAAPVPAYPSAGLLARLQAAGVAQFKGFDDCSVNAYFAHTFSNLPSCITAARLTVRLKPCGDICENDSISLSFTDASGTLQTNAIWGRYLGGGNASPGLVADDWCNHTGGEVFVFDLSALPQPSGPALDLLPALNLNGYLDLASQDDSGVDYAVLEIVSCCCPPPRTVECGTQWAFDTPVAIDACCGSNVTIAVLNTVTNRDPAKPCVQTITRTWVATDCCTNRATCSQTLTVVDRTPPVVDCPPGFGTDCSFPWSFGLPTAVDACSGTNVTVSELSTTTNGHCPFAISRAWLIADLCGNSTTCTQTVVVGDFTPPSLACWPDKRVECGSAWQFDRPIAGDDCCGRNVTVEVLTIATNISPQSPCRQVYICTWVATDCCGNTNTCSQTVYVDDTTPPALVCPHDKTVECDRPWTVDVPTAVDACCGANVVIALVSAVTNNNTGVKCAQEIGFTWSATDCCGNSNLCRQTVTVLDTTGPVFAASCVTNVTSLGGNNFTGPLPASPSPGLRARLMAAGVTQFKGFDDCRVNAYFAHTFTNLPRCITAARLEVRLKPCGDICYNDSLNLSFTSPGGVLQPNSWTRYLGSGNSQPGLNANNWCGHTAGQVFVLDLAALPQPSGPPLNLLPQLNALGYLDLLSQDDTGVDYARLTITSCCYQPQKTVECGKPWTFDPPTATDACCTNNVTVSVQSTVTNGICPKIVTRTWRATDCCGNNSFFSQSVTLIDSTPPVVYCPGPITRYVCTNSARVYYSVYAYDACSGYRPVTCVPPSGSLFPLGTTAVACTATDACGLTGSCSFTVTVANQILTASAVLGLADCYKLPVEMAPKSADLLAAHPGSCWKWFDASQVNCAFGASFLGLPKTLTCGRLTLRMKPNCSDISVNDAIAIGLTNNGAGGYGVPWSSYIGSGNPGPALTPAQWCGQNGCAQTFVFNLASMPAPGGNLLPLINSQGKLDLYLQDDTTVDFARLDYCYCRTWPWWHGFDWPLVNAELAVGHNFASFSPLWSLGYRTNFSVQFAPGATHGAQLELVPLNLGAIAGSSLIVSPRNTLDPDSDAIELTGDGAGLLQVKFGRGRAKTHEAQLSLRRAGTLLAQTNRPPIPGSTLLSLTGPGALVKIQALQDGTVLRLTLDAPNTALEFAGASADEVEITFLETGKSPETLLASLNLELNGVDELQLTSAAAQISGGFFPQSSGDLTARATGDQVSWDSPADDGSLPQSSPDNTVSAGWTIFGTEDGTAIAENANSANQFALDLDVAANASGSSHTNGRLAGSFTGWVGPDLVEACGFSFAQSAAGWELQGDFSALGSTEIRARIFLGAVMQGEVVLSGPVTVPELPLRFAAEGLPNEASLAFTWSSAQSILINGNAYSGDQVLLLPANPDLSLRGLTGAAIRYHGIDALTLAFAGQPLPVWVLGTPVITPDTMTFQWTGPAGGQLESALGLLGPWNPVPGQSNNSAVVGSPRTNRIPAQYFRVRSN